MGLLTHDLDMLDSLDHVDELSYPAMPAGGIMLQHVQLGWQVLLWHMQHKAMFCKNMSFISPGWTYPLYLHHQNAKVDVDGFIGCIQKLMSTGDLHFLPLGSHGHWVLLVIDSRENHESPTVRQNSPNPLFYTICNMSLDH